MKATFDDVNLILRLYEMRREDRMREARNWSAGMSVHTLPNVLVTTDWVAQHPTRGAVRVVEVDVDTTAYRPLCGSDEKV